MLRDTLITNRHRLGGYKSFAIEADIGVSWIYKFVEGKIQDPGGKKLAKVRKSLEQKLK